MKELGIVNPEGVDENNLPEWRHRKAARAVVFDAEGKVGLLHVSKGAYYKLPGGGVEEREDIKRACERECEEELGIDIKIGEEIGSVTEYRAQHTFKQDSFCFFAKVIGEKREPNFTEDEIKNGFRIEWASPPEALKLVGESSPLDYQGGFIKERDIIFLKEAFKLLKI